MKGTYNEKYTARLGVIELRRKDKYHRPGIINALDGGGGGFHPKNGGSARDTEGGFRRDTMISGSIDWN